MTWKNGVLVAATIGLGMLLASCAGSTPGYEDCQQGYVPAVGDAGSSYEYVAARPSSSSSSSRPSVKSSPSSRPSSKASSKTPNSAKPSGAKPKKKRTTDYGECD